jgi:cytochrome c oxidase subunit IV
MATSTHSHPTPKTYWLVGAFLALVTAVEIGVSYIDALGPTKGPLLVFMSIVKWGTVVAVFMHLRYDLRGYRTLFFFGVIGSLLVFGVVLAAMEAL